jgi:hypothetical protein
MAKQTIDIGTSANKGDGDPLRVAFDKINDNFDELYARDTGADPSAFASSLIPSADNTYNLGSEAKQWSDAYIQDFLYLGGVRLSTDSNGNLIIGGTIQQKVDVVASVFADDSTLLVDGVNGKIVGGIETDSLVVGNSGVINFNGSNVLNGGTVEAQTLIAGTIGASEVELLGGGIQSQTDISIDVNLTDSTTYRWKFTEGGDFQFPDNTIQTTAYRGIVSTHSGLDRIEVGGTPAAMDNLSVRLVSSAPGANEVEINYDPDIVTGISVNRYGTNVLGGTEIVSNGNTTWWNIDDFTTAGDGTEFTVTDYDGKIYRVTVIMANITEVSPGPITGDAYCVIERLK